MTRDEIPKGLVDLFNETWLNNSGDDDSPVRSGIAALLTEYERRLREQIAEALLTAEGPAPWGADFEGQNRAWIDTRDCAKAVQIVRGES